MRFGSIRSGRREWGRLGRALYMADFLEPGRKFSRPIARFSARTLPHDFDGVFDRSYARSSSGRCGKGCHSSPRPSSSGTASMKRRSCAGAALSSSCWAGAVVVHARRAPLAAASPALDERRARRRACGSASRCSTTTNTRGLARRATLLLRDRGFDVVEIGTRRADERHDARARPARVIRSGRGWWRRLRRRARVEGAPR